MHARIRRARCGPVLRRILAPLRPHPNSLLRLSDLCETLVLACLALVFAGAVVGAAFVGLGVYASSSAAVAQQHAARSEITAVTTAPASPTAHAAPVRWSHDGQDRTGTVTMRSPAPAGTRVAVWVDPRGEQTTPPLDASTAWFRGLVAGSGTLLGAGVVLTAVGETSLLAIDRARYRRWERAWRDFDQTAQSH